jgi:hypothetical protein
MAKKFVFGDTPVAKVAGEIRADEETTTSKLNEIPQTVPEQSVASQQTVNDSAIDERTVNEQKNSEKAKKSEIGVTVQLPRKYYRLLRDIKDETGISLRDLALRAVMQYVDNYKFED